MTPLAHLGHDLVTLSFFVPTIGFIVWLAVTQLRQRLTARSEGAGPGTDG